MLRTEFSSNWSDWIDQKISEGVNKELLFVVLLNNNFDWDAIADRLTYIPQDESTKLRRQRQLNLKGNDCSRLYPLYPLLADNPHIHRIESPMVEMYEIPSFINERECNLFREKIVLDLVPSTVTDPYAEAAVRTSKTCHLNPSECEYVAALNKRFHYILRAPLTHGENPQGHVYEVGQEFKGHFDYFDFTKAHNDKYKPQGQRLWTAVLYLNDDFEGGHTVFPKLGLEVKPKAGTAVIWRNCYPNLMPNPDTMHSGLPVVKGRKVIITKWFREHAQT